MRLLELVGADRLGLRANRGDGRDDLHRLEPALERDHLLVDDDLGALGLAHALLEVLRDDAVEVVDVVEVDVGEVVDGRVDVARNGDVDEEERAAPAALARLRRPCPW